MIKLLLVGLGGAAGSIMRYLVSLTVMARSTSHHALWGTFAVNAAGCLLIGILIGLSARYGWLSMQLRLLLITGFCGGFTTFSAFAMENAVLIKDGNFGVAALYTLCSVVVCVAASLGGMYVVSGKAGIF